MDSDITVPSPGSLPDARKEKPSRRGSPFFTFVTCIALPTFGFVAYVKFSPPEIVQDNERQALEALKSIARAEADFRANDRDENLVGDYWTGDVAGLYYIRPMKRHSAPELQLISREIADADSAPLRPLVLKPVPFHGYFFVAMEIEDFPGEPQWYKRETDGNGNVHNLSSFGFAAYPAQYGKTGRFTYFITEGNVSFKADTRGRPSLTLNAWSPSPLASEDCSRDLPHTRITPSLDISHTPGINLIWSYAFQASWNELESRLTEPPALGGDSELAGALNRGRKLGLCIDPRFYLAGAGRTKDGVIHTLSKAVEEKFAVRNLTTSLPSETQYHSTDVVTIAALVRDIRLQCQLEQAPRPLIFEGFPVSAFGVGMDRSGVSANRIGAMTILSYVAPSEFVLSLATDIPEEKIILSRQAARPTLRETIAWGINRIAKGVSSRINPGDQVLIPCVNFDLESHFRELEGRTLQNASWRNSRVVHASERIRLRMDWYGDFDPPESDHHSFASGQTYLKLILDGPFLLLLKKEHEDPYFAMWVENPEILAPSSRQ